jgi:hypothetical protein
MSQFLLRRTLASVSKESLPKKTDFQLSPKYSVLAAMILQRGPVVMRPASDIETEYAKYRESLEAERSSGIFRITSARDEAPQSRNSSVELNSIPSKYEPNESTDSDPKNLARKLHRHLYLIVKDRINGNWAFPSRRFTESVESFGLHTIAREALDQCLSQSTELDIYQIGASPVAYLKERFGDRLVAPFGAKHFFFRAQLIAGRVKPNSQLVSDHAWLLKEELQTYLPYAYYEAVEPVLSE